MVESLSNRATERNIAFTVACDDEKAIQKVRVQKHRLKKNMACIDIMSEIEAIWSSSLVKPNPVHVR